MTLSISDWSSFTLDEVIHFDLTLAFVHEGTRNTIGSRD